MASTLAEFEVQWEIQKTDLKGNLIAETPRRRRRGDATEHEVINLVRYDGVRLYPGVTIVCKVEGADELSAYMIHEVRLNTSNYVELWCLNYLSWYEINAAERYKQLDGEFYETNKEKGDKFFEETFASQSIKNELYLTAELSEIYLRDLQFVANIKNEKEYLDSVNEGKMDSNMFLCRSACLPSGTNLADLDIHFFEEKIRSSNPKVSLEYLRDITLPKLPKPLNKSKVHAREKVVATKLQSDNTPSKKSFQQTVSKTNAEVQRIASTIVNEKEAISDNESDLSEYHESKEEFANASSSDSDEEFEDYQSAEELAIVEPAKKKVRSIKPDIPISPVKSQTPLQPSAVHSSPRKFFKNNIVRAKKAYTPFSKRYKNPKDIPDLNDIFQRHNNDLDIAALEERFRTVSAKGKMETIFSKVKKQLNSRNSKEEIVKAADFDNYLPARENEFASIYLSLYSAIEAGTSTSIYIAGTPGVGKTLTVREVVKDLMTSADQKELPRFQYIEINGLKIVKASDSYEVFWQKISGEKLTSGAAMESLEFYFNKVPATKKRPIVVLLDELDALVSKSQDVMYNFFNWATYSNAKLIVVAVANTLDLPERHLGNKISSRIGFTRIMFTGYTHEELRTIINLRLKYLNESSFYVDPETGSSYMISPDSSTIETDEEEKRKDFSNYKRLKLRINPDAIEIASRKIASVSGDVRRALKVVKRAVEYAENDYLKRLRYERLVNSKKDTSGNGTGNEELQSVEIKHITKALNESSTSPEQQFISGLSFSGKLFLYALINLIKKKQTDVQLGDIVEEMRLLIDVNGNNKYILELKRILFQNDSVDTKEQLRAVSWDYILLQLLDAGVVVRQYLKNERLSTIKLNISMEDAEQCLHEDEMLKTF
ncbi:origin recognition complex subunit 1 [Kluyveromyces lactis]|uniref:Origin recognition complex subunit 1 n=1 Tax=Kluyveromyces lactis (strain ATCC 8585 / CBS 2359 / DSM 70799 / NBRC 1267 / NRRL Y-1140 / WM37) TaxID=284590 RepID=ORC1_KLULA|nr:uncharacterized protein KLLA0_B05016g [Kluyveromyces lactis]P54788.2 RecName: Full=Origin recognition complex subunit 1 [Kluyveromyces lactis NRRL Y-1140]CAH02150.1 KLLA0B05016p [Kluyveromyces lactis]|eukprot:XP_451757.1 uncharacterized protein KLLA0_B05016g [Kluyveromyces lactis]